MSVEPQIPPDPGTEQAGVEELADMGRTLLELRDARTAEPLFAAALRQAPDDEAALIGRAQALVLLGRPDEAVPLLQRVAGASGDDPSLWAVTGLVALSAGLGVPAGEAFAHQERLAGEAAGTHLALAMAAYYRLDLDEARRRVRLAKAADGTDPQIVEWSERLEPIAGRPELLLQVGASHLAEGRPQLARPLLEEALAAGRAEAAADLGRTLLALGRPREALAHLAAAHARLPHDADVTVDLATAHLGLGELDAAAELAEQALTTAPQSVDARLVRAQAALGRDDHVHAAEDCDAALRLDPGRPDAWLHLARARSGLGAHDLARVAADHGIALALKANAFVAVGWAIGAHVLEAAVDAALAARYRARARPDLPPAPVEPTRAAPPAPAGDELAALEALVSADPLLAHAYRDRSAIYRALGDYERALAFAGAAWECAPQLRDAALACERGDLALTCGRAAEAVAAFRDAVALDPEEAAAVRGLAAAEAFAVAEGLEIPTPEAAALAAPGIPAETAQQSSAAESRRSPSAHEQPAPSSSAPEPAHFCMRCGAPFGPDAHFCVKCGAPRRRA